MEHNVDNLLDAFISLRDVPDEAVEGMLKTETKLTEGKAFNIYNGADVDEAIDYFTNFVDAPETELEVIDVDANTIRHLKDKTEYVGQGILRCNRCKSNMFINMDDLKPSEEDPELYNIGDECPHCHSEDAGFELIGQVGKVESETEEVVSTEESSDEQKLEPMI